MLTYICLHMHWKFMKNTWEINYIAFSLGRMMEDLRWERDLHFIYMFSKHLNDFFVFLNKNFALKEHHFLKIYIEYFKLYIVGPVGDGLLDQGRPAPPPQMGIFAASYCLNTSESDWEHSSHIIQPRLWCLLTCPPHRIALWWHFPSPQAPSSVWAPGERKIINGFYSWLWNAA